MTEQEFNSFQERLRKFREWRIKQIVDTLNERPDLRQFMEFMVENEKYASEALDLIEMLKMEKEEERKKLIEEQRIAELIDKAKNVY